MEALVTNSIEAIEKNPAGVGVRRTVARVLHDAGDVLHDIDDRLLRLGERDRASFGPLVAELRRELELAKSRHWCG